MSDDIKHPNHYTWHPSKVECRTIVQEFPYNVGVAMSYQWRYLHKGKPIEDLRKAIRHLEFEIERIAGSGHEQQGSGRDVR